MLDNVRGQASYTRSRVRVKFPDGFVLEGNFGGRETIKDIYEYVQAHLLENLSGREFILFETPPKRILSEKNKTLHEKKLMNSCLLYFGFAQGDSPPGMMYINLPKYKQYV